MPDDPKADALKRVRRARKALLRAEERVVTARTEQGSACAAAIEAGATYDDVGDAMDLSKQRAFDVVKAHTTAAA